MLYGGEWGPDLAAVAAACGRCPDEVVALHAGATYDVYVLGFLPGFAYLGDVAEEIRVPRRKEPRTRVPPGSVAVAGAQTAVYPWESPGGWNLLGRCPVPLFDPRRRGGALLAPADRVRFEPVSRERFAGLEADLAAGRLDPGELAGRDRPRAPRGRVPGRPRLGQDLGRHGSRRFGVPTSGAIQPAWLRIANVLAGEREDAPAIEFFLAGPALTVVEGTARAGLAGEVSAVLERAGERHELGSCGASRSGPATCCGSARRSRRGSGTSPCAGSRWTRCSAAPRPSRARRSAGFTAAAPPRRRPRRGGGPRRPGPRAPCAARARRRADPRRAGAAGRPLRAPRRRPLLRDRVARHERLGSDGDAARRPRARPPEHGARGNSVQRNVPGAIQVPGNGLPIVLLADCQTIGGYPRIATVASADLPRLAVRPPGARVRFARATVAEAETLARARESEVRALLAAIRR